MEFKQLLKKIRPIILLALAWFLTLGSEISLNANANADPVGLKTNTIILVVLTLIYVAVVLIEKLPIRLSHHAKSEGFFPYKIWYAPAYWVMGMIYPLLMGAIFLLGDDYLEGAITFFLVGFLCVQIRLDKYNQRYYVLFQKDRIVFNDTREKVLLISDITSMEIRENDYYLIYSRKGRDKFQKHWLLIDRIDLKFREAFKKKVETLYAHYGKDEN